MPLGGLYGVLVGYLVARKQFIGRRTLELVSMINYALPGTIVGIAYLLAFNEKPLELTGTADHHHRLLHLPLQPDRHPRDGCAAAPDRQEPRRGLRKAWAPAASPPSAASRCR